MPGETVPPGETAMESDEAPSPNPAPWHWCPSCRLASSKQGNCPGCGSPYLAVPPSGVPGEPYRPRLPRAGGVLSGAVTTLLVAAVLVGSGLGVWALYSSGKVIGPGGQLVSAGTGSAGASAPTSPFQVAAFGNATLALPGSWAPDGDQYGDGIANEVSQVGGPVSVELSVEHGSTALAIVSVASTDAGQSATELLGLMSSTAADGSGGTITWSQTRDLVIASYPTLAQDFADYNSSKQLADKGTVYCVDDTARGELVVIAADATATSAGELTGIEKALTAMA